MSSFNKRMFTIGLHIFFIWGCVWATYFFQSLFLGFILNSDWQWIRPKHLQSFLMKNSGNNFIFLPDYVGHESLKEFWKNSHFENMRADFFRQCQNWLRQTIPEMMHFQEWKKIIMNWYYVICLGPIWI